jgi:cyclophilin family peptidyl-prolyl cis-trans isomerase
MSLNPLHARTLHSLKLASLVSLFGGILGFGFGCIVTLGPIEPCESGENNKLDDNGDCECRIGYEWCDPNDNTNLNCCDDDNADSATSGPGDGDPTGDGDGDPGDGDGDCTPGELPPETCTVEEEGYFWCTNSDATDPSCSQFFICQGGIWTENAGLMDENCMLDNYDFAYGCYDDGMTVVFECGDGSGAPCTDGDPAFCIDDDQLGTCVWGKETADSCLAFCMEEGIEGTTYEYGECDDITIPDMVACVCCDLDEPGCGGA